MKSRGFTFFEVMATMAILATGIVMIYRAFLLSMDYQDHMVNRLYAMNLLNDKMTTIQEYYQETGVVPVDQSGEVTKAILNNKYVSFRFLFHADSVDDLTDIVMLNIAVTWVERGRNLQLNRTTYISRAKSRNDPA